jgi:hypothetical protein
MYPGNAQKLLSAYKKAVSIPFGALVLDSRIETIFKPYRRAQENVDHQFVIDSAEIKISS